MDFSVIIPVYNRPAEVARAVEAVWASVVAAGFPRDRVEVIVVDNGSTDDTAARAMAAGARVISEPVPNRCNARNRGAEAARGWWLLLLDSDCEPQPQWFGAMTEHIQTVTDEVGAVAGPVDDAPARTAVEAWTASRGWFKQEKYLTARGRFEPAFALMANIAVRRKVYFRMGGLDPALVRAAEDADFCMRMTGAGWQLDYAPSASVIHHHRVTPAALWRQATSWGEGQADLFIKYRADWQASRWIESNHYIWALKGLLKTPWRLITGRTPLQRWEPWLDFVANCGLAWGRLRRGLLRGYWVA